MLGSKVTVALVNKPVTQKVNNFCLLLRHGRRYR